ncbi:hypothetical protein P7K49_039862, partial [Saguinus oedipus]
MLQAFPNPTRLQIFGGGESGAVPSGQNSSPEDADSWQSNQPFQVWASAIQTDGELHQHRSAS